MPHHPPHIYLDNVWYMLTAATLNHEPFLRNERAKLLVRDTLRALIQEFTMTLLAWVILDDHYHLLLKTLNGTDLSRLFRRLHGSTARQLNAWDEALGRQVWHNYWDSGIRSETDLWKRFNYIHHNPVKHGYAQKPDDWSFSSYHYYLRTRGDEWLKDCWLGYPVIDYLQGDDFSRPATGPG
jgi:putative transposase